MMKHLFYYETSLGGIGIAEEGGCITNLYFPSDEVPTGVYDISETALLKEAHHQLLDYLAGRRHSFTLPLRPGGTPFQQSVWQCLTQIPYGKTVSYSEIAASAGSSKACRAVGLANNRNPIPILIPCHRVIGKNGKLTGYRGGLELKEELLKLEQCDGDL